MDEWKGLEDVRITCDDMNSEEDYNKSSNNNNNYNSCLFGWLVGLALVSKRNESNMFKKKEIPQPNTSSFPYSSFILL